MRFMYRTHKITKNRTRAAFNTTQIKHLRYYSNIIITATIIIAYLRPL